MRLLFIHEVNYANKVIFEMHEYPELLALRGHDVTFFHYPEAPDTRRVSLRSTRRRIVGRVHADAEIDLVTPPTFGGGFAERYLAPLLALPRLAREIRKGDYDAIVLYAVPTYGWQTVWLANRAHVPVLFRALDVSHKIRKSPLAPLIKAAEKYVYRRATVVSANNPALADYCVATSGRSLPTVVNVPPVDLSHFERPAQSDVRSEIGISGEGRTIVYMGTFFEFSGLDVLIRGLAAQFAQQPDLRLLLVGGGELDTKLRAIVSELGLADHVIFTGVVPYSRLPEFLKVADVAVNPFRPELLTHVALPHKVLQYMAAGVPTVSTSLDGLRGVLGEDSGVTWVDDPAEIAAKAVSLAYGSAPKLGALSRTQSERVKERFSKPLAVDSFERTLESLRYHASHE